MESIMMKERWNKWLPLLALSVTGCMILGNVLNRVTHKPNFLIDLPGGAFKMHIPSSPSFT